MIVSDSLKNVFESVLIYESIILAIGKYAASGDYARAMIALGDTQAKGSLFQKTGDLSAHELLTVKQLLDANVPAYLSWAKDIFQFFL
jgi:hypothetical protein